MKMCWTLGIAALFMSGAVGCSNTGSNEGLVARVGVTRDGSAASQDFIVGMGEYCEKSQFAFRFVHTDPSL